MVFNCVQNKKQKDIMESWKSNSDIITAKKKKTEKAGKEQTIK